MTKDLIKEVVLVLPKDLQRKVLIDSAKEDFKTFIEIAQVLLDTPLDKGGMSSEEVLKSYQIGFQQKLDSMHRVEFYVDRLCSNGFSTMK